MVKKITYVDKFWSNDNQYRFFESQIYAGSINELINSFSISNIDQIEFTTTVTGITRIDERTYPILEASQIVRSG